MFDNNMKVRSANKPFKVEGKLYDRGTLLVRKNENSGLDKSILEKIAHDSGTEIIGVNTALSESGSDLGGDDFPLLTAPKIAMLAGSSISMGNYGALMHLLDNDLKLRVTILNADYFNRYDLRKYNVLIVPSFYGGTPGFKDMLGVNGLKKLNDWITGGGTLIAIGGSAAAIADSSLKMGSVRLRSQVLSQLNSYNEARAKEKQWKSISIDSLSIWEGIDKAGINKEEKKTGKEDIKKLAELDKENRKFMPQGAIVKLNLDKEHWLNFGQPDTIPALYTSRHVLLSRSPVQTAARLADKTELRLSGLLWLEAKERMSNAAYLTRESKGNGQIILFAEEPNFRSYFEATERLFLNSVLLGPGFGTRQAVEW
jgi:hypothetical protein